jgi:hypothetical protein
LAGTALAVQHGKEGFTMKRSMTIQDLFTAVSDVSSSDAETVATIAHLFNSGKVRLGGKLRGVRVQVVGQATASEIAA